MKIKLDENIPAEVIELLESFQHDVDTVLSESLCGRDDSAVFHAATAEQRVLFTQDLDFSDLRKFKPGTHHGLVLIRLHEPSRRRLLERLRQVLVAQPIDDWAGCFIVLSDRKLRIRRPSGTS